MTPHQRLASLIHKAMCPIFGVTEDELVKKDGTTCRSTARVADARAASIFLQRTLNPSATNRMIANSIGLSKSGGYAHARRRAEDLLETSPDFREKMDAVWARMGIDKPRP